jgi:proline iminopeptidase
VPLAGLILLCTLVAVMAFGLFVDARFRPSRAATLPCRDCTGDARAVTVDGFTLWYREAGRDAGLPPVVVLHGGPGESSRYFGDAFSFLEADRRVILYDQRGSGQSEVKPDLANYTMDSLVAELESLRRDVIRADRIVLIGHSFGGALAQRYTLAHPERVDSLVLVSSLPVDGVRLSAPLELLATVAHTVQLAGIPPADPLLANEWQRSYDHERAVEMLYDRDRVDLVADQGEASFATFRALSASQEADKSDYGSQLSQLRMPVLVLYGAAEGVYTREEYQLALAGRLRRASVVRFERSGHWAFLEEPEAFRKSVEAFLSVDSQR